MSQDLQLKGWGSRWIISAWNPGELLPVRADRVDFDHLALYKAAYYVHFLLDQILYSSILFATVVN